ncbi:MAG: hypothetical protein BJ554DRAFT_5160 [Olpidium bornovanus]|uniref:Uncharacterized protein n=1 Tax=Olpidium bornovanus TaxID=278681 RepID=A0A8H7ZLE4_9FUNG|nr:MAG: hypothetical protein BJ554DRAFT_5160 [Olpidium bornovanus]
MTTRSAIRPTECRGPPKHAPATPPSASAAHKLRFQPKSSGKRTGLFWGGMRRKRRSPAASTSKTSFSPFACNFFPATTTCLYHRMRTRNGNVLRLKRESAVARSAPCGKCFVFGVSVLFSMNADADKKSHIRHPTAPTAAAV